MSVSDHIHPSEEFIQAVKDELTRRGLTASNSAANGKAKSILNAFDFAMGGNIALVDEYMKNISSEKMKIRKIGGEAVDIANRASGIAKDTLREVRMEADKAVRYVDEIKESIDLSIPIDSIESREGKVMMMYSSLLRDAISQGVSPDVACRSASYFMWAFMVGSGDCPTDTLIPLDKE